MAGIFSSILVFATLITGILWLIDALMFAPKRKLAVAAAETAAGTELDEEARERVAPRPGVFEFAESLFPVIAIVLVLRSFIYEPFQIPSGSMMPTLLVGDFILVEKFSYGLREPLNRTKFLETGEPKRGDIVVFKHPPQPQIDYIKRVVGLPGDRVIYKDKKLYIQPACVDQVPCPELKLVASDVVGRNEFKDPAGGVVDRLEEKLGEVSHQILIYRDRGEPWVNYFRQRGSRPGEWLVPKEHYFVMGDNRDNSLDSRFWGFVPETHLVGQAVAIWMSFEFDRDPNSFFSWVPTGVRFSRIGGIE
ncbi:signal peptidase I [Corallincola luteus]|uniref:Signal peptidase I n=1 Tax=Corallincola luteus TaxID=1775177 RepID=A0ABY2AP78_9GAMM|nr:signal peptidase I [Corallincola luteus]TCI05009.1 signal peptidase I [Corallincola luteus]